MATAEPVLRPAQYQNPWLTSRLGTGRTFGAGKLNVSDDQIVLYLLTPTHIGP